MKIRFLAVASFGLSICLGEVPAQLHAATPPKPTYTFKSLGTLGGTTSTADGINELGSVVGISKLADGTSDPYVYTAANGMQNLNVITDGHLDQARQPVFGPDCTGDGVKDLYVACGGVYQGEGASVVVCDGVTGRFVKYFIPPGYGGLDQAANLLIGPDGDFYIPSGPPLTTANLRDRVLRYDGATGQFLGTFVTPGSGGLVDAKGVAFGNDVNDDGTDDFFVTDHGSNEVLAYSGIDGTFIDVFVSAGSGGLDGAGDVRFFRDFDGDGVTDLLVVGKQGGSVSIYSGDNGAFIRHFIAPVAGYQLNNIAIGPEGDLYMATFDPTNTVFLEGDMVLRFDGTTGASKGVFVPAGSGGMSGPNVFAAFDPQGNLYVNSVSTNQVLKFQGPSGTTPGAFVKIFATGVGFTFDTARDINGAGQIVGSGLSLGRRLNTGYIAAYRYTPPTADQDLGNAVDLGLPGNSHEEAVGINENGDVAGHFLSPTDNHYHAFYWTEAAGAVDLGTLSGMDTFVTSLGERSGVNVLICGYAVTSSGYRAWRYNTATHTMQNLGFIGTKGGYSEGFDINSAGLEVGYASANNTVQHAFSRTLTGAMVDLGAFGGYVSTANGINSSGMIIGTSDTTTNSRTNQNQAFGWIAANGMFKLEPQITNLPNSMKLKIRPNRITNSGIICGPGQSDTAGTAFILIPQ